MVVSPRGGGPGRTRPDSHLSIRLRIHWADQFAMGPGKADLLEAVAETHSITAAGRALGYSYSKTRRLLEEMNASFRTPLVATTRGGREGGGAHVTELGYQVLSLFRYMETKATASVQESVQVLLAFMGAPPDKEVPRA